MLLNQSHQAISTRKLPKQNLVQHVCVCVRAIYNNDLASANNQTKLASKPSWDSPMGASKNDGDGVCWFWYVMSDVLMSPQCMVKCNATFASSQTTERRPKTSKTN